ncbi:hypothetical protein HC766_04870 [Candidatus Gracilibacteria bacterium]|nr:hypothetical protein [Candidatus Gracilibacteria bacterium]
MLNQQEDVDIYVIISLYLLCKLLGVTIGENTMNKFQLLSLTVLSALGLCSIGSSDANAMGLDLRNRDISPSSPAQSECNGIGYCETGVQVPELNSQTKFIQPQIEQPMHLSHKNSIEPELYYIIDREIMGTEPPTMLM